MKRIAIRTTVMAAFVLAGASMAFADPIEGMWRNKDKVLLKVSKCGAEFCIDVMDGEYKGKRSGTLKADGGGKYSGTLTKFSLGALGKNIAGKATLNGNSLSLVGTKFGMSQTDNWTRQ